MKSIIDICLSPQLLPLYDLTDKIVVVVDIFRATTTMISALANGASKIRAISSVEEAVSLRSHGFLIAGERGGQKVDGFDFGNSPFEYKKNVVSGKSIAITTTNGTLSINKSNGAKEQIIGAFVNISATIEYLIKRNSNILILCAGWKGSVNLEDTFYAGGLVVQLEQHFNATSDSCILAASLYRQNKYDALGFLKTADHALRLIRLGYEEDIKFCLQQNLYDLNGVVRNGEIVAVGNI